MNKHTWFRIRLKIGLFLIKLGNSRLNIGLFFIRLGNSISYGAWLEDDCNEGRDW